MSFDLYVFDVASLPDDEVAIGELLEDQAAWGAPYTARLAAFVAELESQHPGLDVEPDGSPWSSWPLGDSMMDGRCCGLTIVWSRADEMSDAIRSSCEVRGLTLYDPQAGSVIRPGETAPENGQAKRRWWRRS